MGTDRTAHLSNKDDNQRTHDLNEVKANAPTEWPLLGTKDDMPLWLRDNDFIITSHPMPTYSYKRSLRLWTCWHMETMNIWTHAVGALIMLAAGASLLKHLVSSSGDRLASAVFIVASTSCFAVSATFHTLRSHSYNVHHFCGKLDILGICLYAIGAGGSATYFVFYCNSALKRLYWTLDIVAASAAAWTLFDSGGGGSRMRALRGIVFACLAIVAVMPIVHASISLGWGAAKTRMGASWYLAEGLSLLLGVSFFVSRIPERLVPGRFDIVGHSHQLFHACTVVAAVCHLQALAIASDWRRKHGC